ncbi:hypothetical protein ADIMK_3319 [Marinobacterium lacunae]|uniref:Uncharacterized protein n=1 Tax=Marinobacterium lacunae TaxID=1232683 RepID=A0A081FV73_9GAMM|nr:hypothetical protein [Marinobacterium lacunae]KEA62428.1 hypothetical protein ADIMK_3319 [Marinobacterium lacunae]
MFKKILLVLLVVALLGSGYLWLNKDSFLSEFNQERAEEAQRFRNEGLEYGRSHDQQACLDKALEEFDTQCSGFSCTVRYGKFLNACLETAAQKAGFCDGVPPYREEKTEEDKSWARESCWARDVRGEGCRLLMRQQQFFCQNPDSDAATGSASATGQP